VDALVAFLVGFHIVRLGLSVVSQSLGGLMDRSLPEAEEAAIRRILDAHRGEIVSYHALRSRRVGARRFIDLHLVLHRTMSVGEAHALNDHLEDHVEEALPGTDVTIHVEPCDDGCPVCSARTRAARA
jgi:divalent metal cation (Fe/Co/Zn/Cd) transporter